LTYLATALRNNIPGFVRAAFHDPGTYNKAAGTGGANGSLLSPLESGNGDHRGLVPTINALIRFRNDINAQLPNGLQISAADVIQLAGGLAVEIAGGPSITASIPVGRVDSTGPDATNQLPAENDPYNVIACKFVNNGYSVAEMYALTSAHTLGVVNRNGNRVNLDSTPTLWDLAYWQQTQAGQSVLRSGRVMGTANPAIVSNYAGNQAAVNGDFAAAFVKMGKQGASWRSYGP
jgi:L-ascorbate peroxidase